eukprot:GHVR01112863.1.p1 GENE.GHVR01112863.1~~GHVR01112863.1.p1  ORF type:complete len:110 (+),score=19.96 GHVR01112863.1:16-345(+)
MNYNIPDTSYTLGRDAYGYSPPPSGVLPQHPPAPNSQELNRDYTYMDYNQRNDQTSNQRDQTSNVKGHRTTYNKQYNNNSKYNNTKNNNNNNTNKDIDEEKQVKRCYCS